MKLFYVAISFYFSVIVTGRQHLQKYLAKHAVPTVLFKNPHSI